MHPAPDALKARLAFFLRRIAARLERDAALAAERVDQTYPVAGRPLVFPGTSKIPISYRYYPGYGRSLPLALRRVAAKYPGCVLLDVGANVGDTVAVARSVSACPIHAVEGDRECFAYLRANVGDWPGVHLHACFLDAEPGVKHVSAEKKTWNTTLRADAAGIATPFTTLDALELPAADAAAVRLIKVDAEGFDLRILRGGESRYLARHQPVLHVELNLNVFPADERLAPFFARLASFGYGEVLLFDHAGFFAGTVAAADAAAWEDWEHYLRHPDCPVFYLDVAVFSSADADLAAQVRADARARFP